MKFKLIGTNSILEPAIKEVEQMYLARPEVYEPVGEVEKEPEGQSKEELPPSMEALKQQAEELGLDFKGNISRTALEELIAEALSGTEE